MLVVIYEHLTALVEKYSSEATVFPGLLQYVLKPQWPGQFTSLTRLKEEHRKHIDI